MEILQIHVAPSSQLKVCVPKPHFELSAGGHILTLLSTGHSGQQPCTVYIWPKDSPSPNPLSNHAGSRKEGYETNPFPLPQPFPTAFLLHEHSNCHKRTVCESLGYFMRNIQTPSCMYENKLILFSLLSQTIIGQNLEPSKWSRYPCSGFLCVCGCVHGCVHAHFCSDFWRGLS